MYCVLALSTSLSRMPQATAVWFKGALGVPAPLESGVWTQSATPQPRSEFLEGYECLVPVCQAGWFSCEFLAASWAYPHLLRDEYETQVTPVGSRSRWHIQTRKVEGSLMKGAIDKSTSCYWHWGCRDRRRVGLPEPRKRERALID